LIAALVELFRVHILYSHPGYPDFLFLVGLKGLQAIMPYFQQYVVRRLEVRSSWVLDPCRGSFRLCGCCKLSLLDLLLYCFSQLLVFHTLEVGYLVQTGTPGLHFTCILE
jgi:hypothetical protein